MPRHKNLCKLAQVPVIKGLRAYGLKTPSQKPAVFLHLEEYEAIKLCDYDQKNHAEACALMLVSRPTFTRIYAAARKKIAIALAEGRDIVIEGGKVFMDSNWFVCQSCKSTFNNPLLLETPADCPLCGNDDIAAYQPVRPQRRMVCRCKRCGHQHDHQKTEDCRYSTCPDCDGELTQLEETIST